MIIKNFRNPVKAAFNRIVLYHIHYVKLHKIVCERLFIYSAIGYSKTGLGCCAGDSPRLCCHLRKSRKKRLGQVIKACPKVKLCG